MRSPVVLVSACTHHAASHPYYAVQRKYVDALVHGAQCLPLIVPALGTDTDIAALLAVADGIMLTGSASNVHPDRYGQPLADPALPLDPARDATVLPLIRAAIDRRLPLLAICRGFQELNVALGGTLHQAVHEVPGMADHREHAQASLGEQYAPAHPVQLVAGGALAGILGVDKVRVNSLHGQGIDRLASSLAVEARSADGLVEACSRADARAFTIGVQWHPEWKMAERPDALKLFAAFGQACRQHERVP